MVEKVFWFFPLYAVPAIRIIALVIPLYVPRLNRYLGWSELVLSLLRDFIVTPAVCVIGAVCFKSNQTILLVALLYLLLSVSNWWIKKAEKLKLLDHLSKYPRMQYHDFIERILWVHGPFGCYMSVSDSTSPSSSASIRGSRTKMDPRVPTSPRLRWVDKHENDKLKYSRSLMPLRIFAGVLFTIMISRLVILASKRMVGDVAQLVAAGLALIWSTFMLRLSFANLEMRGWENLSQRGEPIIYLFNHKSFFDFVLIPLVLSSNPDVPVRNYLPRFLLAKNHFKKNFFYYRVLGIGKLAENLGMIFVERGGKKENAIRDVENAAASLKSSSLPLAIFPQGTRAHPHFGMDGSRQDAGYYTVGSKDRIGELGKHIKKGASYLIRVLGEKTIVLPIFFDGVATLCPKGKIRLQAGVDITVTVGERLDLEGLDIDTINQKIDIEFRKIGDVDNRLEIRFLLAARKHLRFEEYENLLDGMKMLRKIKGFYQAIDIIFSLVPEKQGMMMKDFVKLLRSSPTEEEMDLFRGKLIKLLD